MQRSAFIVPLLALVCTFANAQDTTSKFTSLVPESGLEGWHGRPHLDPRKYADVDAEKLAQWKQETEAHWSNKDGVLINDGHGPYLTTDKEYTDYELKLEYRTVAKADSGIYLRGTPQVQIWDTTDESKFKLGANLGSGALWNNSAGAPGKDPLVKADKPFGEWNSVRVIQVGQRTTVYLNDQLVVDNALMENYWDRSQPLFRSGPIQLQTHGGEILWRDVAIREIGADEANQILASHGNEGFESVFDGKTLNGWKGAVDNYEVVDGMIRCKPKHGGTLFTDKTYGDFKVRVMFRLPPGGNNGLAIRYPGEGNPAYSGMTELQVLDNTAEKYAKLDARQYHGSAYGMAAAARGFLRDVGQWNFQEVTVKGPTITVELNGNKILETDVSKVTEFMADTPHPGRELSKGHFGFAGHNDPVEFKEISILPL
ncbi:hypothetical protein CA51_42830 [Rosistilla oblonga]|uniref:3-keto-disaccharide hydrolase n=1 Tax=Rosistilla oblonga TaxID=2527990 RepID=UPI00118A8AC1|nr:DUF1080 domain-containing protein [Rosistilla oblonga]QDV14384.1 hypothetical protein CA51_42830 [Rosistilla oblonga]